MLTQLNRTGINASSPRSPHHFPRAFTLVEILIVVAIVMLLSTTLIPALGTAKDRAKLILCQNQLRTWGLGFATYAAGNDGYYPHIDGRDRDRSIADHFCGWVDVVPPLMDLTPWQDHPPYERPAGGTFFQCPAARLASQDAYGYQPRRDGYFSYAMNSSLELDEDCYRAPGDGGVVMPSFLNTDLIVSPHRVVLLFDQLLDPRYGYGGRRINRTAGKYCGSYPKAFSARHAQTGHKLGGSILFCDYHVEFRDTVWKPNWPAGTNAPPRSDPDWFPYPPSGA
ncbi:MAG: type II secretion system protein [Phycisphaerae bacterium]|nr:type II secretion system protein [Phycisphaerae bacterium]